MKDKQSALPDDVMSLYEKLGKYPNKTIELLLERSSCRSFLDKDVPDDILDFVLQAGVHAPSGGNLQPYSIIKIRDKRNRQRLAELSGQEFVGNAPVILLYCIDFYRLKNWAEQETAPFTAHKSFRHFWIAFQDTMIAIHSICTAAEAMDLASVYVGTVLDFFYEVREMFELPDQVFPLGMLCMGYPKTKTFPRKKLPMSVLVHDEKYLKMRDQELLEAFAEKFSGAELLKPTKSRIEFISKVCEEVQGEEFAGECLKDIEKRGEINNAQRIFALHYSANRMCKGNEDFVKTLEDFGLEIFEG